MSSDSATTSSSQLRQFGLYRTIDARTEEFLKLSRRRQIRQGCACAAVSTAITVTVVVSVLLVYEYGFHMDEPAPPRRRPHWLSMLNDSDGSFDKIQQTNYNINRNTFKLLPILLKAFKQNRYLEKVIEGYPSQAPTYEKTTDYPLERNIFTDTRNWIKLPSRLYAIEYKSSPMVLVKSRNINNFEKATKIMNAQRIMSYIDRMINEKVGYGTTAQVISHNSLKSTSSVPMQKITLSDLYSNEHRQKATHVRNNHFTKTKEFNKAYCKCPNNLGDILNKLVNSIQKLLPENKENKLGDVICGSGKLKINAEPKLTESTSTSTVKTTTKCSGTMKGAIPINCHLQSKITTDADSNEFKSTSRNNKIHKMIARMKKQNIIPQNDLTNIILSSNYQKPDMKKTHDLHNFEVGTTMKAYIQRTENNYIKYITTTKPMPSLQRRKMHSGVKPLERFTFKSRENDIDFNNDSSSKKITKTTRISESEEDYKEMRKEAKTFLQKIKPHINNKFGISESKERQVEPLRSLTLGRKDNKLDMNQHALQANSTVNGYKLYNHDAATKFRRKTAFDRLRNVTEHLVEPIDDTNLKYNTNDTATIISNLETHPKIETIESFLLEHQGNEQDFGDKPMYETSYKSYDYDEKAKQRKTTSFNQFLHKLEANQQNNINFGDNFHEQQSINLLLGNNSQVTSELLNHIENSDQDKNTRHLSTLQKKMKTISNFVESGDQSIRNNGLRNNLGSVSKIFERPAELLNSMIPKNRPQFLEIRRNDGRREERDYDEDTNMNNLNFD